MFSFSTKLDRPPEAPGDLVARLEADFGEASNAEKLACAKYQEATLSTLVGGPDAESTRARLFKTFKEAKDQREFIGDALEGAKAKFAAELEKQKRDEIARRWDEVVEIGRERDELARDIESIIAVLKTKVDKLNLLSEKQFDVAPEKESGLSSSDLYHERILGALRSELSRQECKWVRRQVADPADLIPIARFVAQGTAWLLKYNRAQKKED